MPLVISLSRPRSAQLVVVSRSSARMARAAKVSSAVADCRGTNCPGHSEKTNVLNERREEASSAPLRASAPLRSRS